MLLASAVRFPTAGEGLGDDDVDVVALVGASKTFGPVTVTGNASYRFALGNRDLDIWTLAASLELEATERLTLVAEVVHAEGVNRAGRVALIRPQPFGIGMPQKSRRPAKEDSASGRSRW